MDLLNVLGEVAYILQNSRFGDKFTLKGGLSLMSAMYSVDKSELFRNTTDIDLDYCSIPDWEELVSDIEELLTTNSEFGIVYRIVKRRGYEKNPNGDSIKFEAADGSEVYSFKIDMNVVPNSLSSVYTLPFLDYKIKAVSLQQMIKDKITVLCSDKIFRRVKDVYDLYALSYLCDYHSDTIIPLLSLGSCVSKLDGDLSKLEHAYSKFQGIRKKPDFSVMVKRVNCFTQVLLEGRSGMRWNIIEGNWENSSSVGKMSIF